MTRRAPKIDRENAETLEQVQKTTETDAPFPAAENQAPYLFTPAKGLSSLDMAEILLMRWIQLTNPGLVVEKGALRSLTLTPDRVVQLSDQAQAHFQQVAEPEPEMAALGQTH